MSCQGEREEDMKMKQAYTEESYVQPLKTSHLIESTGEVLFIRPWRELWSQEKY